MRSGKAGIWMAGALALLTGAAGAQDVGPFGPPMGVKAEVVRSFSMKTTGAVAADIQGKKGDDQTGLRGQCNPSMFANFSFEKGSSYEGAEIAIVSKDPIKTGMTGEIKLDKIYVRFFDLKNDERRFGGPGKMTLTVHDAAKGKRRMTGTITGTKLEGLEKLGGKFVDVTASFDADFSCGVK
ncbi:MAG TPA: hypothetical protein VF859_13025 [Burkholderiales bacterium]